MTKRIKFVETEIDKNDYVGKLCKMFKLTLLGKGMSSETYGSKSLKRVVKVGYIDCGVTTSDSGKVCLTERDPYLDFAMKVWNSKPNPFLPVIESIEVFYNWDQPYETYFVVVLERLKHIDVRHQSQYDAIFDAWSGADMDSLEAIVSVFRIRTDPLWKSFQSAMRIVYNLAVYHELDMHDGNVMLRGDQLVITDPLSRG